MKATPHPPARAPPANRALDPASTRQDFLEPPQNPHLPPISPTRERRIMPESTPTVPQPILHPTPPLLRLASPKTSGQPIDLPSYSFLKRPKRQHQTHNRSRAPQHAPQHAPHPRAPTRRLRLPPCLPRPFDNLAHRQHNREDSRQPEQSRLTPSRRFFLRALPKIPDRTRTTTIQEQCRHNRRRSPTTPPHSTTPSGNHLPHRALSHKHPKPAHSSQTPRRSVVSRFSVHWLLLSRLGFEALYFGRPIPRV